VLALGGGTVMTPECAELVKTNTLCIYLRASVDTLMEHLSGEDDGRPMLNSSDEAADRQTALRHRIEDLMALRAETYEREAHIIIDTDGKTIYEIAQQITTLYTKLL
jgi:shikimate kinase